MKFVESAEHPFGDVAVNVIGTVIAEVPGLLNAWLTFILVEEGSGEGKSQT